LLHVLAKSLVLVAIAAFLAGVLIDSLLHRIVEASLTLLQLRQLILADDVPCFLIKVSLLVVLGQLQWCDFSGEHLRLSFGCVGTSQSMADGVDAFVQCLFGLVLEHVLQLFEQIL
jgi:hypothetical protein